MRTLIVRLLLPTLCLIAAGCASRPLPKFETPIARTQFQRVRTTAYTHTEDDHVQYSNHNALGGCLRCGPIHSAAADWSRWPAGTVFRIQETGEVYEVDDYGWALAGTNTIDLYKPSRAAMNAWGVKRVTIENLQWGDPHRSLAILRQRSGYKHIRRMISEMEERMAELDRPMSVQSPVAVSAPLPSSAPGPVTAGAVPLQPFASTQQTSSAISGQAGIAGSTGRPAVAGNPFYSGTPR